MQDEDPGASCWFDDFTSLLYGHAEAGALPPMIHPRTAGEDDEPTAKDVQVKGNLDVGEAATTDGGRRRGNAKALGRAL